MGRQDFLDIRDSSNVVALDFGSAEFRRNAHRLVAGWARQPPFYVLGDGPPQVIVGRYADVHEVFSDRTVCVATAERAGLRAVRQIHGLPVPHPDGRRAARAAAPAADAGVLLAPHGADGVEHHRPCRNHARRHRAAGACVRCDDTIRRQARGRRAGDHHDGPERGAATNPARLPGHGAARHRDQAGAALSAGMSARDHARRGSCP